MMTKSINFNDLKKPFPPELISWRVGATNKKKNGGVATKGIALAYIDARDVMQLLDEVCGPSNWQCLHPHANGKTSCRIGIKVDDEWIWKENGAGDSAQDAEKGAFSDSFKRAAVLWGVGRYLYDVPNVWVDLDQWGGIKDHKDARLKAALEAATKGIRLASEEEPEPDAPFSGEELLQFQKAIRDSQNLNELKIVWEQFNTHRHRINADQKNALELEKEKRKIFLSQAPIDQTQQQAA